MYSEEEKQKINQEEQISSKFVSDQTTILFKKDYVSILQSFLCLTSNNNSIGDLNTVNNAIFNGGNKHKEALLNLLEECRKIDLNLPSWQSLIEDNSYTDPYGFKNESKTEIDSLHYVCQLLKTFYSFQPNLTEDSIWDLNYKEWRKLFKITKEIKQLVRKGIPANYRSKIWSILIFNQTRSIKELKGPLYYMYLCNLSSKSYDVNRFSKQINQDLLRTMPNNIKFSESDSEKINHLRQVLQAFCVHNPKVGYCQGMNFIVGVALIFLKPEDAFWCLVAVTEKYFLPNYFDSELTGVQVEQKCLKDIIKLKLPDLHNHIESLEIDISSITLNWLVSIFLNAVPFDTLLRIWDCFLLEGSKVLLRYSCALLSLNKSSLMEKNDAISLFNQLRASAKLSYDVEGLTKIAYEGMKPFPNRKEIQAKQIHYNTIFNNK